MRNYRIQGVILNYLLREISVAFVYNYMILTIKNQIERDAK